MVHCPHEDSSARRSWEAFRDKKDRLFNEFVKSVTQARNPIPNPHPTPTPNPSPDPDAGAQRHGRHAHVPDGRQLGRAPPRDAWEPEQGARASDDEYEQGGGARDERE